MKTTKILLALLATSITPGICQTGLENQAEEIAENVLQRDGTFYPTHTTLGQSYYEGTWYETIDMAAADARWKTTIEELVPLLGYSSPEHLAQTMGFLGAPGNPTSMAAAYGFASIEDMATNIGPGFESPNEMAIASGYSSVEEMALAWGYGTPDVEAMVEGFGGVNAIAAAIYSGYEPAGKQLTPAEKGSLLDAIRNNSLDETDYNELFYPMDPNQVSTLNNLFTTGTDMDAEFANSLIEVLQENSSPYLQAAYNNLGRHLAETNDGIENIDFSNWINPDLRNLPLEQMNLSWNQINNASNTRYANFSNMNVAELDTSGKDLMWANFENSNVTTDQLNAAGMLGYANLTGLNLNGFQTVGKPLVHVNFSNTTGITASQLAQATSIHYTNLSGTGITKAELDATLVAAGRNPNSGNFNTNTITF